MDPGKIVSTKLTQDKIWEAAELFREQHIFSNTLPVDIEIFHLLTCPGGRFSSVRS